MAVPVLALVFTKLVKNRYVKYAKFLDNNNPKLNLKIYIRHKNTIFNQRIESLEKIKMML